MSKLRENIDRILGNSIRCLLPSYWWKRLFGMVVDEMEGKASKSSVAASVNAINKRIDDIAQGGSEGNCVVVVEWDGNPSTQTESNRVAYATIRGNLENNKPIAIVVWITTKGLANPHYIASSFNLRKEQDDSIVVWIRFSTYDKDNHKTYIYFNLLEDGTFVYKKDENIYDEAVSSSSTNAVQNKTVTEYINRQIIFIDADDTTERNEQAFKLIADAYQEGRKPLVYAVNGHFLYIADSIYLSHPSGWEYHRLEFHAWTDTHYHADYTDYRYRFINLYADGKATSSEARVIAVAHEASDTFDEFPLSSKAVKAYVDNSIASAITNTLNTPV